MTAREPRLGVDIGRVLIAGPERGPDGTLPGDTSFFDGDEAEMLATPEVEGAVGALARLVALFEGRVWLVSKCGPETQARTERWLEAHEIHRRTGLPRANVRYCPARPDKRGHCMDLELTHFVDDHPEVHEVIRGVVDHQYAFGPQQEAVPAHVHHTPTWADVERLIEASLRE